MVEAVQGRNLGFQLAIVYHLVYRVDRRRDQTNTTLDPEGLVVKAEEFQISCKV